MPARPFDDLELLRLLHEQPCGRDRALWFLLATTGLRVNEALALTVGDVFSADAQPLAYITAPVSKRRKGPAKRLIPLAACCCPDLIETHATLPDPSPTSHLFRRPGLGNYHITPRHASRLLYHACRAQGFRPGISTHSFRKWIARKLYMASGKDIVLVQMALGHRSPNSTIFYLSPDSQRLRHCWNSVLVSTFGLGFRDSVDTACDTDFQLALPHLSHALPALKADPSSMQDLLAYAAQNNPQLKEALSHANPQ